jgi:hypothetical protein
VWITHAGYSTDGAKEVSRWRARSGPGRPGNTANVTKLETRKRPDDDRTAETPAIRKSASMKSASRKSSSKKSSSKKSASKKSASKKPASKKSASKKSGPSRSGRRAS